MKRSLVALLFFTALGSAFGFDLTTTDGVAYQDFRLIEKNDGGVRFFHSGGAASLSYLKMRPEDARMLGYDESKYEAWAKRPLAPAPVPQAASAAPIRPTRPARAYVAPAASPSPATARAPVTTSGTASGQCTAYTKKGYRCSRMAASGSSTCWQH